MLNKADGSGALSEPDRPDREPAQRSPLRLHVREPRGARQHASDPRPSCCASRSRASRSRSSTSRACPRRSSTWWSRSCSGWCSSSPCGATAARRRRCCWCARRPIATCREEDVSGFAPTKRVISRIAKEGRKYGVTLVPGQPAAVGAVDRQPVAVQHRVRAAPDQRARSGVRRPRAARERALAGRQPAVARTPRRRSWWATA